MYILYIEQGCPWGNKVMAFMEENGITPALRDRDKGNHEAELIKRGGKRQTPYLVDLHNVVEMYGSAEIIEYLKRQLDA